MNNWGIPDWLEREVKERDKTCVYCGIQMIEHMPPRGPRKLWQRGSTSSTTKYRQSGEYCPMLRRVQFKQRDKETL